MDDPLTQAIGIKWATICAGVVGSILSLRYVRDLSTNRMAFTVIGGTTMTNFVTPVAMYYVGIPELLAPGVSFLIGLCGMSLIGWFLRDPLAWLKAWRGK